MKSGNLNFLEPSGPVQACNGTALLLLYIYDRISLNPLTPNDPYRGRTALLTSKRCILYIYSTNIGNEYFKHGVYSSFFPFQNAVCFIILTYLVPVLFTFYIQGVLKLKKIYSGAKRLILLRERNVSDKIRTENYKTLFRFHNFFFKKKSYFSWDNVQNILQPDRLQLPIL
jgi:predicted membrane protein